ncbi:hypothetical protein WMY93_034111 [Mugilogobius chulae]|uniref:Chemokine interleukin-8-like domain-containing protein n=1 Tax=Mugilogobius chulae TaxID=88201 RepID=A0AAW0MPQ4_9GOBI
MDPRACVLLLLLCAALCTADIPQDCCLTVSHQRLPPRAVLSYQLQEEGKGCHISATVVQVRDRRLCLPPPEGHPWVKWLLG